MTRSSSVERFVQSWPAAAKASLRLFNAGTNRSCQSDSNCWRAGPTHVVPASTPLTVDITVSIEAIWFWRLRPSPASCSGSAPYMLIVVPPLVATCTRGVGPRASRTENAQLSGGSAEELFVVMGGPLAHGQDRAEDPRDGGHPERRAEDGAEGQGRGPRQQDDDGDEDGHEAADVTRGHDLAEAPIEVRERVVPVAGLGQLDVARLEQVPALAGLEPRLGARRHRLGCLGRGLGAGLGAHGFVRLGHRP